MLPSRTRAITAAAIVCVTPACSDSSHEKESSEPVAVPGTSVVFEVDADTSTRESFYDLPYPSDLRLDGNGAPSFAGLPRPDGIAVLESVLSVAEDRRGYPVIPVAYFRFDGPLAPRSQDEPVAADPEGPLLLIDVDEESPERGRLHPVVAELPEEDAYTPANLLAVAPLPGVVLRPSRKYAFVVLRSLGDAAGEPLGVPLAIARLSAGQAPEGKRGEEARELHTALRPALELAGVEGRDVAASTVFTTGDVVERTAELAEGLVERHDVQVEDLVVDPDDGAAHPRYCELVGTVSFPQFQRGVPPYAADGLFVLGADGLPVEQRRETANVVVTLPKRPMPAGGYPLVVYFHGSGGTPAQIADRGRAPAPDAPPAKGEGPAHVLAPHGFAMAGTSLPVNPERLEGAGDLAYLNFNNPAAFRDTFRQGIFEQRLFFEALARLEVAPSVVAACDGLALPSGESAYHLNAGSFLAMGQSMGGAYTDFLGAVEPRIGAVVPTGAGGYWSYMVFGTKVVGNLPGLLGLILETEAKLTHLHPALNVLQTAWEAADPIVYAPRIARWPLDEHPPRPIYEPVGYDDEYFQPPVYDAAAIALGNEQAGDEIWPQMQAALRLVGRDGLLKYPVEQNGTSDGGEPYTGVVVQYEGDGIYDPHHVFAQLDVVKHQYGCFFETFQRNGAAVVPAPAPLGTTCDE